METNELDVASLKQHFTDEELQSVLPKEESTETVEETVKEEPLETEVAETVVEQPAPDSDKVSKHVPYDRFKEVNEKAKALAAELAALKAQKPVQQQQFEQPNQPNQVDSRAKYYAMLSASADEEAREIHGIGKDVDLGTDLQFTDNPKYQAYLDTKAMLVQGKHTNNVNAFQVRQQNEAYVGKLQQDPLFAPVYQYATEAMQELPGREFLKFKEAEARVTQFVGTGEDFTLLDKYMNTYKAKYLAASGQPPTPASKQAGVHSPLDKTEGLPRANNLSGAKTSAMSWAQVEDLIRQGKADQIPREMLAQIDPKLIE